jgi:hypothetical protein
MVRSKRRWLELCIYPTRQSLGDSSECLVLKLRTQKSELKQRRKDHGKNDHMGNKDGCGFGKSKG